MRTIAQIIYDIEEMENSISDFPEEYSYDRNVIPLKLELADTVMLLFFEVDGMSAGDAENALCNMFELGEE